MTPLDSTLALGQALELLLKAEEIPLARASRDLGFHPATLGRLLRGGGPLRAVTAFQVVVRAHMHPAEFFSTLYPLGGLPALELETLQKEAGVRDARVEAFDRFVLESLGPPLKPEEYAERMRAWCLEALKIAHVSQRKVSRRLGLGQDAVGQALRGNSQLTFLHLFAVLEAVAVSPGRFFYELFLKPPQTTLQKVVRAQLAGLLEKGIRGTASGYLKRMKKAGEEVPPK